MLVWRAIATFSLEERSSNSRERRKIRSGKVNACLFGNGGVNLVGSGRDYCQVMEDNL